MVECKLRRVARESGPRRARKSRKSRWCFVVVCRTRSSSSTSCPSCLPPQPFSAPHRRCQFPPTKRPSCAAAEAAAAAPLPFAGGRKKKRKAAGKKGGKAGAIYFRANVNSRPGRGETARLGRAGPDGARRRGNAERRTRVETETCRWGPAGSGEAGGGAGVRGRRSGGCEKKSSAGMNDDDGGDGERGIGAGTTKARAHRTPHTAHT